MVSGLGNMTREEKDEMVRKKMEDMKRKSEEILKRYLQIEADKKNADMHSKAVIERKKSNPTPEVLKEKKVQSRQSSRHQLILRSDSREVEEKRKRLSDGDAPHPDPNFNFLSDPLRKNKDFDETEVERKEPGFRQKNNFGGEDFQNVKSSIKQQRNYAKEHPMSPPKNKMEMALKMTGIERRYYENWGKEREEIDEQRIARQNTSEGTFKGEWDNYKIIPDLKDQTTRDQTLKKNHDDVTALFSRLKTRIDLAAGELSLNSAAYAEIKSQICSLEGLLSQETKYQQKELDSINIEINPQDHGSLINDLEGQEKRTELFQTTLSELERRKRQITDSLYQSSLPEQEDIKTFKSEIITLKSHMLKCLGQMTGDSSKLMELDQFQNRLNEITRNFIKGVDGIEKCELKLKELNDDILKSIVMASEMTTSHPLITQTEKEKEEDDDAQSDKNGKKGDGHQQTKNKINCVENKNTKGKDKTHGKKREGQEEDEGKGTSTKRSKQEQESLNRKLLMNAREGNADQVGTLIENGANPNVQDENGRTPSMLAVIYGHKQFVEELLRLREEGKTKIAMNKTDNKGNTALHYCVLHERKSIVGLLVQNMNFLNHKNDDGETPMVIAEKLGYQDIWNILKVCNELDQAQQILHNASIINGSIINFYQSSPTSASGTTTIANTLVNSESNCITL